MTCKLITFPLSLLEQLVIQINIVSQVKTLPSPRSFYLLILVHELHFLFWLIRHSPILQFIIRSLICKTLLSYNINCSLIKFYLVLQGASITPTLVETFIPRCIKSMVFDLIPINGSTISKDLIELSTSVWIQMAILINIRHGWLRKVIFKMMVLFSKLSQVLHQKKYWHPPHYCGCRIFMYLNNWRQNSVFILTN